MIVVRAWENGNSWNMTGGILKKLLSEVTGKLDNVPNRSVDPAALEELIQAEC